MYRDLVEMLEQAAQGDKGIRFIRSEQDEKVVSYQELYTTACRVLHHLQARGVRAKDEVLIQIENNERFLYVFWACLLGNMIPVPISVGSKDEHTLKLFKIWQIVQRPYLVTEQKRVQPVREYATAKGLGEAFEQIEQHLFVVDDLLTGTELGTVQRPAPDDIAFLQFSSGSTGDPKGVVLTHANLVVNIHSIAVGFDAQPGDSMLCWVPYTHDMGMIGGHLFPIWSGLDQLNMEPMLFVRRPVLWLKKANQYRVPIIVGPNFGYKMFLQAFKPELAADWDLSPLKVVLNGAEPVSAELMEELVTTLAPFGLRPGAIFPAYGLAEACVAAAFTPVGQGLRSVWIDRDQVAVGQPVREVEAEAAVRGFRVVECGCPVVGVTLRICAEDGTVLPDDHVGQVHISGANVTQGYYNNPEATERALVGDGWLNTGDLGFMRGDRLYITGRAKEIIFVQGQNYYPHDIERVASAVPGVDRGEAAACGVYNAQLHREEILIFVQYRGKLEQFPTVARAVRAAIAQEIGLAVAHVIPLRHMPKTTSGKTQRYLLADDYQRGEYDQVVQSVAELVQAESQVAATARDTEAALLQIAQDVLGVTEIGLHDNFNKFGCTSMQMQQMQERMERLYPSKIKIADLFAYPSVSMLADLVEGEGSLLLGAVRLPEAFYAPVRDAARNTSFALPLGEELSEALCAVATQAGVQHADVLVALGANLLAQVSGQTVVTVQTQVAAGDVLVPLTVDFEQVTGLGELFHWVQRTVRDLDGPQAYRIGELTKQVRHRDPLALVPLFSDRDVQGADHGLAQQFDLIMEWQATASGIELLVTYNSRRLQTDRVQQLARDLVQIVRKLTDAMAVQ